MKLVNPMGRQADTLETGANYAGDVARSGCVCSGSNTVANAHNQGPSWCVGYCEHGDVNRHANMETAKYA
jgi:hypothetical protein